MITKTQIKGKFPEYFHAACTDPRLKNVDKGILFTLATLPEDFQYNAVKLSAQLTETPPTVRISVDRLEQNGYLKRNKWIDSMGRTMDSGDIELVFQKKELRGGNV